MADVCPECAADLRQRDPAAHSLSHWPEYIDPRPEYALARERQAELAALAERRRVEGAARAAEEARRENTASRVASRGG